MHFDVKTSVLSEAIKVASHATTASAATPILENTLITAQDGKVVFTANNLEMAIEVELDDVLVHDEGKITLSHRFLSSYASLLNEQKTTIKLENRNTVHLLSENNTTQFKGISAAEFPVIPMVRRDTFFRIPSSALKRAFGSTLFSAAAGNVRPTLAGVYVSINPDKIVFASTDSFRLSEYQVENSLNIEKPLSFIIPAKTASELMKLLPEEVIIEVYVTENQLLIFFNNIKIFSRLLNGHFPDYGNFFPKTHATRGIINRHTLAQALKQVSLISRENNYNTKVYFKPGEGLQLDTGDTEVGTGKVKVAGEVEGQEDNIGVNSVYLLDVLGVIKDDYVSMSFETSLAPVLIEGVNESGESTGAFRHIIMPLKI